MNSYKRIALVGLVVVTLVLVMTSCALLPRPPAVVGYMAYARAQAQVESDSVIAVVSYASSALSRSEAYTPVEFELFFSNQCSMIVSTGVIHSNYPVAATAQELAVCRVFMDAWLACSSSLRGATARDNYAATATEFITYIADTEYQR